MKGNTLVNILLNATLIALMSAIILFFGFFDVKTASEDGSVLGEQQTSEQSDEHSHDDSHVHAIEEDDTETPEAAPAPVPTSPVVSVSAPVPTPTPVVTPSPPNPEPTPTSPYPTGSVGSTRNTNAATRALLARMGMSESWLWNKGIKVLPYNGPVQKRCALNTTVNVAGLAVKSNAVYPKCADGQEVIFPEYRTPGKCTVVYDWTKHTRGITASGNSYAVLAHEIAHCLHFLYGENTAFQAEYFSTVRPEVESSSRHTKREVLADDFMICRFGANTSWGTSYYDRYGVSGLSAERCATAKTLFAQYFGI